MAGAGSGLLTPIILLPVASSILLKRRKGRLPAEALSGMTLLHSMARPNDWETWLRANHTEQAVDSRKGLRFESSALAYEAALQGSGVAMGIELLVAGYLASGALVSPFGQPVRLPGGYYLVRPRHRPVSLAMRRFRDWILTELDAAAETGG